MCWCCRSTTGTAAAHQGHAARFCSWPCSTVNPIKSSRAQTSTQQLHNTPPAPPPPTLPYPPQLAEGMTLADHFWRTYPTLFLHKCPACNGCGSVICPSCKGYKARGAQSGAGSFRLSEMVGPRRRLQRTARDECEHCGGYCDWDDESEWEEK